MVIHFIVVDIFQSGSEVLDVIHGLTLVKNAWSCTYCTLYNFGFFELFQFTILIYVAS